MTEQALTPSRLWKRMTPEQRFDVARAFWLDEEAADDQVQAVLLIAQRKKFRPKSVLALDADRKAKHLSTLPAISDQLAARALIVYHLTEQREMMGAFLDALGITHENGLIQGEDVKPDPDKVPGAVAAIASRFPDDRVSLYLNTLRSQDPATWDVLDSIPQTGV
jgi:hypothetical protein